MTLDERQNSPVGACTYGLWKTRKGICIVIVRQTFACSARTFSKALSARAVKCRKSSDLNSQTVFLNVFVVGRLLELRSDFDKALDN
jgi:hypothetical protein